MAQHKTAMDQAQDWRDDLKDALDAKELAKAGALADKLVEAAMVEEDYWKKAKQADIVKLAAENLADSRELAAQAKAGKSVEAAAAYDRLEVSCRACHDLHPEKRQK